MVPSHWANAPAEGAGFAIVGWLQIAIAVVMLANPSRLLLRVVMLVNVGVLGAWAVSRTSGLPFGDHAGHPHDAQFVDLVCVGIEIALVCIAAIWLTRPSLGREWRGARLALFAIVPISVLTLGTAALASPSARNHSDDSHTAHTTTLATDATSGAATGAHVHAASGVPPAAVDDKGFALLSNGHHHAIVWHDLDPVTNAELNRQLDLTRQVAARFPTLADAAAAGYKPAGPYGPGAGIHYIGGGAGTITAEGSLTDSALVNPGTLLFDGTGPDAKLAGLMYSINTAIEPVGFVGTNDVWHDHIGLCIVISDKGITTALSDEQNPTVKEQHCPLVGGRYIKQTGWMMHVWTAPGYENPGGVFAEENPLIACSDGTYFTATAAERTAQHPDNACKSGAAGRPSAKTLAAIKTIVAQ
jgi:hypothetical protein